MTAAGLEENQQIHDIIVVGAAMVGSTLALGLASLGYRVALIDARSLDSVTDNCNQQLSAAILDQRTTAVTPVSLTIMQAFGLWQDLSGPGSKSDDNFNPITEIQVSQQGSYGTTRIRGSELGVEALGYVVANQTMTSALIKKLRASPGVELFAPRKVVEVINRPGHACVVTEFDGLREMHRAKLVVAVDGTHSLVRKLSDIKTDRHDYQQSAIVTSVESELDNRGIAFERFTPGGPVASLPMQSHVNSFVYTVTSEQAGVLTQLPEQQFLDRLQKEFGFRLGTLKKCGARAVFPLTLVKAKQQFVGRVLLMGNAARTLHPVAGQSFNLAMRDVGKLVEILRGDSQLEATEVLAPAESPARMQISDPGDSRVLQLFSQQRHGDQQKTVWLTDGLARSFRGNSGWFSHLRAAGITGLDTVPAFRNVFARHAMGFGESLPDLDYPG